MIIIIAFSAIKKEAMPTIIIIYNNKWMYTVFHLFIFNTSYLLEASHFYDFRSCETCFLGRRWGANIYYNSFVNIYYWFFHKFNIANHRHASIFSIYVRMYGWCSSGHLWTAYVFALLIILYMDFFDFPSVCRHYFRLLTR